MTFESNGPEGKVRGNATQVYEKYLSLAREAVSSGNRVMAETFFQHAEHYYRVLNDSTDPRPEGAPAAQPGGPERAGDGQGARRNGGYEGGRRAPPPAGDGSDAPPQPEEGAQRAAQPKEGAAQSKEGAVQPKEGAERATPPEAPSVEAEAGQPAEQTPSSTAGPDEAPATKSGGSRSRRGRPRSKTTDGAAASDAPPRRGRPRRDASAPAAADPSTAPASDEDAAVAEEGPPPDKASA